MGLTMGAFVLPTLDVKYRYAGTNESEWAFSTGLATGLFFQPTGLLYQISLPNNFSYFPTDWLGITGTAHPVLSHYPEGTTFTGPNSYFQSGLGLRCGSTWGFTVEGGILAPLDDTTLPVSPTPSLGISKGF